MITQFMEELPEGMSTPDFTRKPIALTIQQGKPLMPEKLIQVHVDSKLNVGHIQKYSGHDLSSHSRKSCSL